MPSRRIEHTTLPPYGMEPTSAARNGENIFAIRCPISTQLAAIDSCTQLATRVVSGLDIEFPDAQLRYEFSRNVVLAEAIASGHPKDYSVSREALDDWFGSDGNGPEARVKVFRNHRAEIEALAREIYINEPVPADGAILIKTADIPRLRGLLEACLQRSPGPLCGPEAKFAHPSHVQRLYDRTGRLVSDLVISNWYQARWGDQLARGCGSARPRGRKRSAPKIVWFFSTGRETFPPRPRAPDAQSAIECVLADHPARGSQRGGYSRQRRLAG